MADRNATESWVQSPNVERMGKKMMPPAIGAPLPGKSPATNPISGANHRTDRRVNGSSSRE